LSRWQLISGRICGKLKKSSSSSSGKREEKIKVNQHDDDDQQHVKGPLSNCWLAN
jgi:hypothetical protein